MKEKEQKGDRDEEDVKGKKKGDTKGKVLIQPSCRFL